MGAIHDSTNFPFVRSLEAAFEALRSEVLSLTAEDFVESPDSLTTISGRYDETGWRYFDLYGEGPFEANQAKCPAASQACAAVPGMVNAGISLFRPGTHLYPHGGEMEGILRCHLPLLVPEGDVGLQIDGSVQRWREGRCLIFDDTYEHEAWNHGDGDRALLLVTFRP